ncbi:MAG: alpha/beta hydrolase [Nanoarchaeota archaeon]|nr:alpha/beta hydrolase [Nanoarchaeota archaeon]
MKEVNYKQKEFFELYAGLLYFQIQNFWNLTVNLGRTKQRMDDLNKRHIEEIKDNPDMPLTFFLHGIMQNYHSFLLSTVNWFKKRGLIIIPIGYDFRQDLAVSAAYVSTQIKALLKKSCADKVNLIGVSYGGLISRYYSEYLNGASDIDKLITVCTPYDIVPKTDIGYKIHRLIGGHPKRDNIYLEQMAETNSVKNHLAIHALNDRIIKPKKMRCPGVHEIWVKGGHHPSSHHPERLELILDYLK